MAERMARARGVWGVLCCSHRDRRDLCGWFTPTEAAGIGAFGALLFALARRTLTLGDSGRVLSKVAAPRRCCSRC
jgi:hypothetical protein